MGFSLAILRKEKKENVYRVSLLASEEEASVRGILDFLKNTDLRQSHSRNVLVLTV